MYMYAFSLVVVPVCVCMQQKNVRIESISILALPTLHWTNQILPAMCWLHLKLLIFFMNFDVGNTCPYLFQ